MPGQFSVTINTSSATFALNSGLRFFRFDISDLLFVEYQQTVNCNLRQCPHFGGGMYELPSPATVLLMPL